MVIPPDGGIVHSQRRKANGPADALASPRRARHSQATTLGTAMSWTRFVATLTVKPSGPPPWRPTLTKVAPKSVSVVWSNRADGKARLNAWAVEPT
jgi:hypothetical protein